MKTIKLVIFALVFGIAAVPAIAQKPGDYGTQTKEKQAAMTPQQALQRLKDGNQRFVSGKLQNKSNYRKQVAIKAQGQFPYAAILSCLDSRVAVESIFDLNNGDSFNGRVAGNVMNPDMLGSFEFATKLAGAKVVMVLGHSKCGAVMGACDRAEMGNLTGLLDRIEPAVDLISANWREGEKNSKNSKFVEAVGRKNVELVMQNIKKESPILKEMIEKGQIILVGGIYDLETGKVEFIG